MKSHAVESWKRVLTAMYFANHDNGLDKLRQLTAAKFTQPPFAKNRGGRCTTNAHIPSIAAQAIGICG